MSEKQIYCRKHGFKPLKNLNGIKACPECLSSIRDTKECEKTASDRGDGERYV